MEIKENQELIVENVLSLRKKMEPQEMQLEMMKIREVMQELGVKKNGNIITATYAVEQRMNSQLMDIEIIVPLDKKVNLPNGYKFKPLIKIVNALMIRYQGNPNRLDEAVFKLNQYIEEHQKQVITATYNVTVENQGVRVDTDNMTIDIYVGCSPCIV